MKLGVAFILCALAAAGAVFWPGSLSPDSHWQWDQAQLGLYSTIHPPIMALLWRLMLHLFGGGPRPMLCLHVLAFSGGLLLIARYAARWSRLSAALVGAAAWLPPLFGNIGAVWKDVGLLAFFLLGLGIFLTDDRLRPRTRWALWLACLFYSAAVRKNGVVMVPTALAFTYLLERPGASWKRVAAGALAVAALFYGGEALISNAWLRATPQSQGEAILIQDIAAIHAVDRSTAIDPRLLRDAGSLGRLEAQTFNDRCVDQLIFGEGAPFIYPANTFGIALGSWWPAVSSHPGAYLAHRAAMFASLNACGYSPCLPYHTFLEPGDEVAAWRVPVRAAVDRALDWATWRTQLFEGWWWAVVALGAGGLLVGWRVRKGRLPRPGLVALAWAACAFAYALPYAVVGVCCDFRYLLLSVAGAYLAAALLPAAWAARGGAAGGAPARFWPVGRVVLGLALAAFVKLGLAFGTWNPRIWPFSLVGDFVVVAAEQDYGAVAVGHMLEGGAFRAGGQTFTTGLGTHAHSAIRLEPRRGGARFAGVCAFPDHRDRASIVCEVRQGGKVLATTAALSPERRFERFEVPVAAGEPIDLEVRSATPGSILGAHAFWADLRLF